MLDNVNVVTAAIRQAISMLDCAVYFGLEYVFQLFFNVASTNVINGKIIFDLFSRVQLIIGIFMVFLLTINIIKGIINPDTFTDSKSGFGNIISRIVISLILLALLVPLNISSPKNNFEKRINNSGILFGTLYSLQERVLEQNTIGKLIFGNNSTNYTSNDSSNENIFTFSRRFSSAVIKTFYIKNTNSDDEFICEDLDTVEEIYDEEDVGSLPIVMMATQTCTVSEENANSSYGIIELFSPALAGLTHQLATDRAYALSIIPLLSTIAGIALAVLMFMITFDVAVRVFKLAALQLLAPIPIISYMDPKGGKDGAFNTWVKLLVSTYLDLFIHLGVIYFALSIISSLLKQLPDIALSNAGDTGSVLSTVLLARPTFIILCIGLLIFAKDAPKFFKEMLGIKGDKKFFSAFGDAIGLGATAWSAIGSFNTGRSASRMADETNHDKAYADRFANRAKHLVSGIFNAGKGLAIGSAAASESKGNGLAKAMAAMKAVNKNNEDLIKVGSSGSTAIGRAFATGAKLIEGSGNTSFDKETRAIAQKKGIKSAGEDLANYLKGKGGTDGANFKVTTDGIIVGQDASGKDIKRTFTGSVNELYRLKADALAKQQRGTGDGIFHFPSLNSATGTLEDFEINVNDTGLIDKIEEELKFAAGDVWAVRQEQQHLKHIEDSDEKDWDFGYAQKRDTYNESIKDADDPNKMGLYKSYEYVPGNVPENDKMSNTTTRVNKASKAAGGEASRREANPIYKKQEKDFGAVNNK